MRRGHLNRSLDIRYSIDAFNISLLTVKLQLRLSYRKVWINWSWPWDKICSLIFLILFKWVCLGVWKLGQWRKKFVVVSVSLPQSHNGSRVSWKQCLNLWSRRWLRPSWVMNIKNTICTWPYKVKQVFLKIERVREFLILESRLFHSDIVQGKNELLK